MKSFATVLQRAMYYLPLILINGLCQEQPIGWLIIQLLVIVIAFIQNTISHQILVAKHATLPQPNFLPIALTNFACGGI